MGESLETFQTLFTAKELKEFGDGEHPFIIDFLAPKGCMIAVYGSSASGKSTFVRQMALSIAGNKSDFCGFKIKEHGKALVLSAEDGKHTLATYFRSLDNELSECVNENLLIETNPSEFLKKTKDILKEEPDIKVVIIDTYLDVLEGDSFKTEEVRQYLAQYRILAEQYGLCIIWVHHINKSAEKRKAHKNNINGAQGFQAMMRVTFEFQLSTSSDQRRLVITKSNVHSNDDQKKSLTFDFKNRIFTKGKFRWSTGGIDNTDAPTYTLDDRNRYAIEL